jgi:D-glycero-D-manno-heptose 1,7-bisphosphate phosphatase
MSTSAIEQSCSEHVYRNLGTATRLMTVNKTVMQTELFHQISTRNPRICDPRLYSPKQSRLTKSIAGNHSYCAVFLDRDGTVVEDVGYLTDLSQLKLLPAAVEGIRLLQDQFLIVIVTNQAAVARGLLDEEELLSIHQELAKALQRRGALLDAVYACPHDAGLGGPPYNDQCYCRKPQPGMLLQARDDFGIQLGLSFMVGDKGSDILAGQRAGVAATVLIRSYQTESSLTPDVVPDYVTDNLYNAARLILDHQARNC